jgi:hypothetical protein
MNDNGHSQTNLHPPPDSKKSRKVLGRGLKEILESQSIAEMNDVPEHVLAARIGAAILELVDIVSPKYHPVIFKSVTAYRSVGIGDTTEEISLKLHELESKRIQREKEAAMPKRRWYFLYLR